MLNIQLLKRQKKLLNIWMEVRLTGRKSVALLFCLSALLLALPGAAHLQDGVVVAILPRDTEIEEVLLEGVLPHAGDLVPVLPGGADTVDPHRAHPAKFSYQLYLLNNHVKLSCTIVLDVASLDIQFRFVLALDLSEKSFDRTFTCWREW